MVRNFDLHEKLIVGFNAIVALRKRGSKMPVISMFYGIKIYIYDEFNGKHHKYHIHAQYNEYEMSVGIDGEIITGNLPKKQQAMVIAWVLMNEESIRTDIELLEKGLEPFRIEGLR